jgi:hypothetical protein
MFCPNCKAEYREGFTKCSDCGVALVRTLADASASGGGVDSQGAVELLWSGTDSAASGAISEALNNAKISFHETTREVGPLPGLARPVYAILIHSRDRVAARAALDDARRKAELPEQDENEFPEGLESALPIAAQQEDSDDSSSLPPTEYVPEDFHPEDATAEVWSGTDAAVARSLKDSLRENGIGCALAKGETCSRLAVLPSNEARAREIIREVVEGIPPE